MLEFLRKVLAFFRLVDADGFTLSLTSLGAYIALWKLLQAPTPGWIEVGTFIVAMGSHQLRANRCAKQAQGQQAQASASNAAHTPNESPPSNRVNVSGPTNNLTSISGTGLAVAASQFNSEHQPVQRGVSLDAYTSRQEGGGTPVMGPVGVMGQGGDESTTSDIQELKKDMEAVKAKLSKVSLLNLFPRQ